MIEAIGIAPNNRNGRACLLGTTITMADVAIARPYHGLDAEGIAGGFALNHPFAPLAYF